MAAMFNSYNSINRRANHAVCASALVLPILDAVMILAVSVLVCLRVTMLGS